MLINRLSRALVCLALCAAIAGCGLPKPRPAADVELDREFTAKFGLPGQVPLEAPEKRGPIQLALNKVFGDPTTRPKPVRQPPAVPPIRVEPIPRAPRNGVFEWQPSAWEWNGSQFVWILGAWVQPPPTMRWQSGHWTQNDMGDWIWITGGWV